MLKNTKFPDYIFISYQQFFKTISWYELEKMLKDATVKHCRVFYAQIKDFRHL